MTQILIVEDEPDIAQILRDYLLREGFQVILMDRGDQVVSLVKKAALSMLLLDIMLPGMDGISILREIRKFSQVPVMMITAKVEEVDRIVGFELGVDDYVCKPFSPREVVVRVKAILRRVEGNLQTQILTAGPIQINRASRTARIRSGDLALTPSEFEILSTLMESPDRVFTRGQLIEKVQGYNYDGYERTIDFHVKNLRKKISEHLPDQKVIRSSYGLGYKFVLSQTDPLGD